MEQQNQSREVEPPQTPEAPINPYHLPPPDLTAALATASGDILLTNAQKSPDGPDMLIYNRGERAAETIYATSERDYLMNLQKQLATYLTEASQHDPQEVAFNWSDRDPNMHDETFGDLVKDIEDFRDNLIYIDNVEFERSTDLIAERIIAEAEQGYTVGVYDYKDRSPRYVMTKVLEKAKRKLQSPSNYAPEEAEKIRQRIIYGNNSRELVAQTLKDTFDPNQIKFHVIDDFALSNTYISGAVEEVRRALIDHTANRENYDITGITICSKPVDRPGLKVEPIYPASKVTRNYTDIAVAGSWSSTDYAFENVLERFSQRLGIKPGMDLPHASSHKIKGRYDKDANGQFLDPQYAEEYEQIKQFFS